VILKLSAVFLVGLSAQAFAEDPIAAPANNTFTPQISGSVDAETGALKSAPVVPGAGGAPAVVAPGIPAVGAPGGVVMEWEEPDDGEEEDEEDAKRKKKEKKKAAKMMEGLMKGLGAAAAAGQGGANGQAAGAQQNGAVQNAAPVQNSTYAPSTYTNSAGPRSEMASTGDENAGNQMSYESASTDTGGYCANPPPDASFCESLATTAALTKKESTDYIHQCGENCGALEIVPRANWGAAEPMPQCDAAGNATYEALDDKKLEMKKAECAKTSNYDSLKSQVATMEAAAPKCIPLLDQAPSRMVIHHTAGEGMSAAKMTPKAVQDHHMKNKGWSDIAYHYMIGQDDSGNWTVFEGRKRVGTSCMWLQGAHGGPGSNDDSIGIVIAGNYDDDGKPSYANPSDPGTPKVPPGALQKLIQLVANLKRQCPQFNEIMGHSEHQQKSYGCSTTACPGSGCSHLSNELDAGGVF
jgi:hypothetical protein